jgi:hypothetical protein
MAIESARRLASTLSRTRVSERRIVLVTGCPRSGTTAIGACLAEAAGARYLYEPFNYHSGVREIRRYFEVPGAGGFSRSGFDRLVDGIRSLQLDLKSGLFPEDSGYRRLLKGLVGGRSRVSYLLCRLDWRLRTIIWKDPIASFAAGAASRRHGIPVLATVRDPLAVAASFRRMDWAFDLPDIGARLEEAGIATDDMAQRHAGELRDPVVNAAVLWRWIYASLLNARSDGAEVEFVDVERVVADPLSTYRHLYERYGLEWSRRVAARITRRYASAGPASPTDLPRRAHVARRDVAQINRYGLKMLEPRDVDRVAAITGDLWDRLRQQTVAAS